MRQDWTKKEQLKLSLCAIILVIAICLIAILLTTPAKGEDYRSFAQPTEETSSRLPEIWRCPVSQISDNDKCMDCHKMILNLEGKPVFGLKEISPAAAYWDKPIKLKIVIEDGQLIGYMDIDGAGTGIRKVAHYLYRHPEIRKLVLSLQTPGGSIMSAWRTVGIIQEMQENGIIVATRCYGMAASAGAILLVAGNKGHRVVGAHTQLMMHKVWTFKMFAIADPDSAEDEAQILKHFQKNINDFFIERTRMTEAKIKECTFKKDFWLTGRQAVEEYGLADVLVFSRY